MTPAARLQAAIEVLEAVQKGAPADRALARWGRAHRFAGSKDRAAIADRVYLCLRQWRSISWRFAETDVAPARAAVLGSVTVEGVAPGTLFDGQRYGPAALTAQELARLEAPLAPMPAPVRLDYPDWLDGALRTSLGAAFEPAMEALRHRAPLDLRVNTMRASLDEARAALAEDGIEAVPVDLATTALRTQPGAPVSRSRAYREGLVELQDAASQAAAALAQARPGETVLDFCAGGGGKTLALAASMQGRGRLVAHDAAPARLRDLPGRAARAGVAVEIASATDLAALVGRCNLVFVDAPCSGSGSWRRDPGGKWRLTPAQLEDLPDKQAAIVAEAARYLAPGGRLAYATCSVLAAEAEAGTHAMRCAPSTTLRLTPADGCDGFYCALW